MVNGAHIHAERSLGMTGHVLAVLTILAVIGLSSCAIKPIPLTTDEVRTRAQEDRSVLTKDQEPVSGPIDVSERWREARNSGWRLSMMAVLPSAWPERTI